MKGKVSALLDGELDSRETSSAFAALRDDAALRQTWGEYQTIGAALRGESGLGGDLTARVMVGLEHDVTVLAPRRQRTAGWHRPLMALAASVAGVAVVGWVAFSPQLGPAPAGPGHLARAPSLQQPAASSHVAAIAPSARRDMQEYLVAHQAQVPASQVLGGTRHIRTVSVADGSGPR